MLFAANHTSHIDLFTHYLWVQYLAQWHWGSCWLNDWLVYDQFYLMSHSGTLNSSVLLLRGSCGFTVDQSGGHTNHESCHSRYPVAYLLKTWLQHWMDILQLVGQTCLQQPENLSANDLSPLLLAHKNWYHCWNHNLSPPVVYFIEIYS